MKIKNFAIAIAMMFAMTLTVNAQSLDNQPQSQTIQSQQSFDNIAEMLELSSDQWQPVKTAFQQFSIAMETLTKMEPGVKMQQAWDKIRTGHFHQMQRLLTDKQLKKYQEMFELTVANRAAKYIPQTVDAK